MSETFHWCKDKTRLSIWDKQVFCFNKYGAKFWYMNGERHRKNGPAIEWSNGNNWYLNGKYYKESNYWKEINK